jgi:hypothetical protein
MVLVHLVCSRDHKIVVGEEANSNSRSISLASKGLSGARVWLGCAARSVHVYRSVVCVLW